MEALEAENFAILVAECQISIRHITLQLRHSFVLLSILTYQGSIFILQCVTSLLLVFDDLLLLIDSVKPTLDSTFLHHDLLGQFRNFLVLLIKLSFQLL